MTIDELQQLMDESTAHLNKLRAHTRFIEPANEALIHFLACMDNNDGEGALHAMDRYRDALKTLRKELDDLGSLRPDRNPAQGTEHTEHAE